METLYSFYAPVALVFSTSPIWMMGRRYDPETIEVNGLSSVSAARFLADYNQKIWFSYRRDFPTIENTAYTTDAGWGCMLRSGQMMLAQALVNHKLGREWTSQDNVPLPAEIYEIIKLFGDNPTAAHPYSIHDIARVGQKYGKTIGDWFAPSIIALSLSELSVHRLEGLKLIVSDDGAVYKDKIAEACASVEGQARKAAVIMVPLRLGLDTMNPVYYSPILELFQFPQSLGIVGGKPRASMYFIACQDDNVFYLDPHVIQPSVNTDEDFLIDTFHTTCTKKMHVSEIDPSLALAFYCKDKEDLDDFYRRMDELSAKYKDAILFTVAQKAPDYHSTGITINDEEDEAEIEMDMDMVVL